MSNARLTLIDDALAAVGSLMQNMVMEVVESDPDANKGMEAGLQAGERPVMVFEFSDVAPKIRLCLVDDYERLRQVMLIEGKASRRQ